MRKVLMIMLAMLMLVSACVKKDEYADKPEILWSETVNCDNKALYDNVCGCNNWGDKGSVLWEIRNSRFPEYDYHIGSALVWQIEKNAENNEVFYHVVIQNDMLDEISKDVIDRINVENNLNLNIDKWVVLHGWQESDILYYYIFTEEEIKALAANGLWCKYVGNGDGYFENIDFGTDEGIDVFCELYGDQYFQKNRRN